MREGTVATTDSSAGLRGRASRAADAVEHVSDTRVLDVAARLGFGALAVVHILIGLIALRIAFGGNGEAEPTGALEEVAEGPAGTALMWICAVGCAGLALWQFSEATLRARHLPRKQRIGKLISSGSLVIIYGSMAATFARFALGDGPDSSESTVDFTRALLASAFGVLLVFLTAGIILGIGVHFVVKGVRRNFRPELRSFEDTAHGRIIEVVGVVGHVAKGLALLLVGGLFVIAGLVRDAQESTGLDGSLKALQHHPLGTYVLTAVALGLICYGAFAVIRSVFGRM
ncbi:hypothetical protein ASF21_03165 [Arthrobacter sp. Leaf234]|uniref:DUF1206 domain-containing protein n=1 Tax=Arthrobacter sp. Leaf234 TaxID=1736303 RepID=UPI0006FF4745|nr:DUF1206 domain-containing protein [Arthrobacter sp. Leaf234]KQO03319.1 hypothetical protein ASF21_03165 [Arthrobacter sp. Leaf234]